MNLLLMFLWYLGSSEKLSNNDFKGGRIVK